MVHPHPAPAAAGGHPLILLDFDGTLLASEAPGQANLAATMAAMTGLPAPVFLEFIHGHHGRTLAQYYDQLLDRFALSPQTLPLAALRQRHAASLFARFRAEGVTAAPGLTVALARLRHDHGAELRICTNSELDRVEAALDGAERLAPGTGAALRAAITAVHAAARPKPDPEVYLSALAAARGVAATRAPGPVAVVEDSISGLRAAAAARERCPAARPFVIIAYAGLAEAPAAHAETLAAAALADRVVSDQDWGEVAAAILTALDAGAPAA